MREIVNEFQAAAWNGVTGAHWAEHHERYDAISSGFNGALFRAAGIQPRDRVLDIGCGNGQTTLLAARLASEGQVDGIDLSRPMLIRARETAVRNRITNVTFIQGDAQVYPFVAGAFDVVISRGGVMFFGDHVAAFQNIARAMRPGGRVAFILPRRPTAESEEARAFAALGALAREQATAGDDRDNAMEQAMLSLADPERIHSVFADAGFSEAAVDLCQAPVAWGRTPSDAADFAMSMGRNRQVLADLDDSTRHRVRREILIALEPFASTEGVRTSGSVWLVSAVRS